MLLAVTRGGKLLMHLRDDKAGILHPGCWAGFGGTVEPGESPEDALRREVLEETGVSIESARFLGEVIDEPYEEGSGDRVRMYCSRVDVRPDEIRLNEGAAVGVFDVAELRDMKLSPFVERTIRVHESELLAESLRDG